MSKRYWLTASRIKRLLEAGHRVVGLGESRTDLFGGEVFLVRVYT